MEVNNTSQTYKYYSEAELQNCLTGEHVSARAILALIERSFEQDKSIAELKKTVNELNQRISYLEKKNLQKAGRPRREFYFEGQELTDEYLMQLIDEGYVDSISKLEKELRAGKNQLRNRYNKAKEKLQLERRIKNNGHC